MKVLEKKYPKGSFKSQKTDGRYIDALLYQNLKLLATKIKDDMTFLGICSSSTLEVGTGKSVLLTQIGEIWTELIKEVHNIDVPFDLKNVVFRPEELIERAFQVPKYSCILLDEWEDAHYWSTLGMTLRKFFRKCRQLNLFILVIIPNFFQLPINYAIGRSIFFIDVKFDDNLERGNYDFYGFKSKKSLFIKGKKYQDYGVQRADFEGEFMDGYGVPEEEYRKVKYLDMLKYDDDDKKIPTPLQIATEVFQKIDPILTKKYKIITKDWAEAFEMTQRTIFKWRSKAKEGAVSPESDSMNTYNRIHSNSDDNLEEGGEEKEEET